MSENRGYFEAEERIFKALKGKDDNLSLNSLALTEVPDSLGSLIQLESLSLNFNQLREFPNCLKSLTKLKHLEISYNSIIKIPEWIGELNSLNQLILNDNAISLVPDSIADLKQLYVLDLRENQIVYLTASIRKLRNLSWLDLSRNLIRKLPNWIGELTSLKTLRLNTNPFDYIPDSIRSLSSLEYIIFGGPFDEIPNSVTELKSLQHLNFIDCNISEFPSSILNLKNLESLSLYNNQLTRIPKLLSQLVSLKTLHLGSNKLTHLPDSLGRLSNLQSLNLRDNKLTDLPTSITRLSNLNELFLHENPLNPELNVAFEQGLDSVKTYLREKAKGKITLNEAKLILIGEGEVGKTSLLSALRGDPWIENRPSTHGVEVDIKPIKIQERNEEIQLNCWDFGGQNIYRHTHQLFFTAPAIYLAVWAPRRGAEQSLLREWIKMVKHRAYVEESPENRPRIIVVATHGGPKDRLDHIDQQAFKDEFGDMIIGFHHVDSKPNIDGVCFQLSELISIISREASFIPTVWRTVPISWKNVLDSIRKKSVEHPYISYSDYEKICIKEGISSDLASTYAILLNELGHVIYYPQDQILKNLMILKPEYLSKAIGFVLEDRKTKDAHGLIEHSRLTEIWNNPERKNRDRYPTALHPILLRLMDRFDLTYKVTIPGGPETSLMAQLVPNRRPEGWNKDWIFRDGDTEKTQVIRVLDAETGRTTDAEGLMYRLIVRLHRFSLGQKDYHLSQHWKTGMILDDRYNGRGFIEDVEGDLRITVRGAYPELFLHQLCTEIQWLVENFWKGLDARVYIPCPKDGCKGLLDFEEILEYKQQGIPKIRCAVCKTFLSIDELISTRKTIPEFDVALHTITHRLDEIKAGQEKGFEVVETNFKSLLSQVDEQFTALMTTLTDPAKDGPRLFSFEPMTYPWFNPKKWTNKKFKLVLWCEHCKLPLTAINENGDRNGVYELELTNEWLQKAAPFIKVVSKTLSLALPLVVSGVKLETTDQVYKGIQKQLEFTAKTAEALIKSGKEVGEWMIGNDSLTMKKNKEAVKEQGSALRELHAVLKEVDPNNRFGGLVRVQNKKREFLWVHESFVQEY